MGKGDVVPSLYLVAGGSALDCVGGARGLGVHTADSRGYMDGVGNATVPSPSGQPGVSWASGVDVPDGHPQCRS